MGAGAGAHSWRQRVKIASWNVNSIGKRLARLTRWLDAERPDIVCLQETKTEDVRFPAQAIEAAGYHVVSCGQKAYNGVAILSRTPLQAVHRGLDIAPEESPLQARYISAETAGLTVASVYVPNGMAVGSDKYAYKLAWLARLRGLLQRDHRPEAALVLAGDFNVAPREVDVAFPERWARTVICHPEVREAFARLTAWGLVDVLAQQVPEGHIYSWWDYRMLGFAKGNGLRIDLLLATASLAARVRDAGVDRDERRGPQPSDHAPAWVVLADAPGSGA